MQMADRDCENCKHYKWFVDKSLAYKKRYQACECWKCDFEPKESANENAKKTTDGKSETGDM